jgi:HEPN domain-containing protein
MVFLRFEGLDAEVSGRLADSILSPQMNRFDLQKMAEERVADASALLGAERYQAAYYICGYAIECALKACVARKTREFDFPDRKVVNDSYVHDLTKLLKVAAIDGLLQEEEARNRLFAKNWGVVKDWSETSRYDASITAARASVFFLAVTDESNGVLSWLKKQW